MSNDFMELPADPTWEPMTFADVLDQDGCYKCVVTAEKPTKEDADKPGVWLTLEIQDGDTAGKRLQKMLPDVRHSPKSGFQWRGLIMSIHGKEAARQGFRYQPNVFVGQTCYVKTGAYLSNRGEVATGIDDWIVKADYDQAVAKNAHRWPRKVQGKSGDVGAFGLPTSLPAGLPTSFGAPQPQPAPVTAPAPLSGAAAVTAAVAKVAEPVAVPQPKANAFPSFPGLK